MDGSGMPLPIRMGKARRRIALVFLWIALPNGARADVLGPYAPIVSQWVSPSREEVGAYKTRKFVDNVARSLLLGPGDSVYASTCRRTLVLAEFLDEAELKRPAPPAEALVLSSPVTQPLDVFKAIRATGLGRAILKKFLPKYGTEIKVEMSDNRTIRSESESSALAFYDPVRRLIRIEKDVEIGMVSFVLLHEIIHALDRDYGLAIQKQGKVREAFDLEVERVAGLAATKYRKRPDQLAQSDIPPEDLDRLGRLKLAMDQMQDIQIFRAERFAYDASYDVWKQLAQLYPDYYKGKSGRDVAGEARINLKGDPVFYDDDHIVRINNLNPVFIRKYKEGKCLPWSGSLKSLPK
jgi:hypothetical protein